MLFKRKLSSKLLRFVALQVILLTAVSTSLLANDNTGNYSGFPFFILDTIPGNPYYNGNVSSSQDSLPFPNQDRRGDFISSGEKNTFDLNDPSNIKDSIAYDPQTHLYTVYEKIGNNYYRTPTTYTFDEYWQMISQQQETDYFRQRANTLDMLNHNLVQPKLSVYDNLFNRLFGNGKIDIVPQGNVDVIAGYQGQNIDNPTLPEASRKSGGLDFNMNSQVNVNASIGDKLKFPINYNTLANFGQENQLKLDYTGTDDEIIKRFTAGNVNFTTRSTLIPGAQQLFGIKTQLQFGKLFVTGVLAQQKSQRQTVNLQGGSATQVFNITADQYQENQHFFLAQYFRDNFNQAMSTLPAVTTSITILRLEVWVTNHIGTVTNARTIVGLSDLGEDSTYLVPPLVTSLGVKFPSNTSNTLYNTAKNVGGRDPSQVVTNLQNGIGLQPVQDFEKTFARLLDSSQYTFNRQLGYISLNQPLQSSDVLGVAYQYSYNGHIYQVGEFSTDVPPDTATGAIQQVIYVKLLKATSQRPNLPIWKLMMKNIYSVGYGTLNPSNFQLNVLYQQPSLGTKNYVPFGDKNQGTPIISLVNLDRLNSQLEPQPDGVFDYVEGYTVVSQYSRVIFPVLEPFGRDLANAIYTTVPSTVNDSLYYALYDSLKVIAQEYPNLNRFVLNGKAQTSGSADISIGYNIPKGSVTVTSGGQTLVEGTDYDINYDLGTIKIINQAILNAGLPVQVNFENNATFGTQQRNYMGLRFDYNLKNTAKEQLNLGGTIVKLSERPYFTIVNYGQDPIDNTMYGVDGSLKQDMPRITKLLNKLPFYQSTTPSTLTAYGEGAFLKPGHASQIGKGSSGAVYIDDFESSAASIDLRFPAISWALASTPYQARDSVNGPELFPESDSTNSLIYGMNRARMAWYQIDPILQQYQGSGNPIGNVGAFMDDPRARFVYENEIFPQVTTDLGQSQLVTFDLAYYPKNKGPYNFDTRTGSIDANDNLENPQKRWGGLMRSLDQTDFITANVQYIEFWMQDPYIQSTNTTPGGKLYFDLGDVSEDILRDGNRFFENGLPTPNIPAETTTSVWGIQPANPIQVTNAFDDDPTDRAYQDVGFDGLSDSAERIFHQPYLNQLSGQHVTDPQAQKDPSLDDYVHYLDPSYTTNSNILARYKYYSNSEGNSPINNGSSISSAATLYPDAEDLNQDNTTNETEQYFQYMVHIEDTSSPYMQVGTNFIINQRYAYITPSAPATGPSGVGHYEKWYQFRIPINSYDNVVGTPDFNSIRFIRMFLTGFSDSIVMRFGELQLTRNTWRNFQYEIDTSGNYDSLYNPSVTFNIGAVSIEQDDQRVPLPYVTPSSIQRQQIESNNGVNLLLNEQSMSLQFCGLGQNDSRGAFETLPNMDLRSYGNLLMFIHAEADPNLGTNLKDTDLTAIIRIGSDFINNYYEVQIPLYLTPLSAGELNPQSQAYNDTLWRSINNLNLNLTLLPALKEQRNLSNFPQGSMYAQRQPSGQTYSIVGNPNLGQVAGILIGVQNSHASTACGQIWVDELRLTAIDEKGGAAALAKIDMNLSDLGTISASATAHTIGFGTLEQEVNERAKDDFTQYDVAANLELGKLLPKKAAISIPMLASYTQSVSTPEYDPYDGDIKLKDKLNAAPSSERDSIKNYAVTFNSTKTINFTNVHKNKTDNKKPKIYDITNFTVSYSFVQIDEHDPLTEYNNITRHHGNVGYNYITQPTYIEPFKKLKLFKKVKTHWLDLIKDFNFNLVPSQLSVRADISRQFGVSRMRSIGSADGYVIPETFNKYFNFERDYIFRWSLTRSLKFDLTATNTSVIDEPFGHIVTKAQKDTIWRNLLKGGRNTLYNQTTNFTYTLPTSKFPLTDFATVDIKYQATYNWIGASLVDPTLGNILENGQQQEAIAQLDFTKIYSKFKFFRALDQPRSKTKDNSNDFTTLTDTIFRKIMRDGVKMKEVKRIKIQAIKNPKLLPDLNTFDRVVGKLLSSIKQVNASISENANTRLPGYTDSTQYLGQNWRSMEPGFGFILGGQPDTNWLNRAAAKGLISKDSTLSDLFQQSYNQKLTLSALLEPVKGFHITVNVSKSFNKNYSELFKDTTGTGNNFGHLSPYAGGGFDISYISFKTLFVPFNPNQVSQTFLTFQNYRVAISQRLGKLNPNSGVVQPGQYAYGYNLYASDVLIPAFIAAYTGEDPNKVGLVKEQNPNIKSNPFNSFLPEPNWRLDYNGLSKIKGLDKIFTSITFTHAYSSDLSMNGFTSALVYQSRYDYPSFYDSTARSFVPYFLIPNLTIQEQFAPLGGVDMTLTNQMQFKFEYDKLRTLSLSLIDYQLSETRSTSFTIGGGYKKKGMKLLAGLPLPKFLSKKGTSKLDNEIDFRFDFKIQDNVTANSTLDQMSNYATSGSKEITLSPNVNYFLNKKVNIKLFLNRRRVIPYISSSAPITTTQAGVEIRISLAP